MSSKLIRGTIRVSPLLLFSLAFVLLPPLETEEWWKWRIGKEWKVWKEWRRARRRREETEIRNEWLLRTGFLRDSRLFHVTTTSIRVVSFSLFFFPFFFFFFFYVLPSPWREFVPWIWQTIKHRKPVELLLGNERIDPLEIERFDASNIFSFFFFFFLFFLFFPLLCFVHWSATSLHDNVVVG